MSKTHHSPCKKSPNKPSSSSLPAPFLQFIHYPLCAPAPLREIFFSILQLLSACKRAALYESHKKSYINFPKTLHQSYTRFQAAKIKKSIHPRPKVLKVPQVPPFSTTNYQSTPYKKSQQNPHCQPVKKPEKTTPHRFPSIQNPFPAIPNPSLPTPNFKL